jgi:hypothetical protein
VLFRSKRATRNGLWRTGRRVGPTRLPVAHLSELHKDEITSRSKAHIRMYTRARVCAIGYSSVGRPTYTIVQVKVSDLNKIKFLRFIYIIAGEKWTRNI